MLRKVERFFFSTNNINSFQRFLSTKIVTNTEKSVKKPGRTKSLETNEIYQQFASPERILAQQKYPEDFFVKKRNNKNKTDNLYIADERAAQIIYHEITKDLPKEKMLMEVNPGIGLLTELLIKGTENDLFLYETKEKLFHITADIIKKHQDRKISLKQCDFKSLWKMEYLDRLDDGNRVKDIFGKIPPKDYNDETVARLFSCAESPKFFKDLINSLIFQNGFLSAGRIEMFLCVPAHVFIRIACSPSIGYFLYRATAVLFQLLFEYEFITKIDRNCFLPWTSKPKETARLGKIIKIDYDYLYLIRVVPRKDLFRFCQPEHLITLWFFVKQHLASRTKTVIPALERWIPACGPRLIVNSKPSIKPQPLFPNSDISGLSSLIAPCTTLSTNDFLDNIHIFTQFGMLTPTQILSIFNEFKSWPEFESCTFNNALEKELNKLHTKEEDDDESSDDEMETVVNVEETIERPKSLSEILSSITQK